MSKPSMLLTDEVTPLPALVRAGLEARPAIIRTNGERASLPLHRILHPQHLQP
jgi:hypothetical protein